LAPSTYGKLRLLFFIQPRGQAGATGQSKSATAPGAVIGFIDQINAAPTRPMALN
jgi:hypothetical protein